MASSLFAYDLRWSFAAEILPIRADSPHPTPDVSVNWAAREHCRLEGAGSPTVIWRGAADEQISLKRGPSGDYLFVYGRRAVFHLTASLDSLFCHTTERDDPGWRRVLLDTVMFCTALLRGRQMMHAAAVSFAGQVVAIAGATGSGKSSLAWELMRRGGSLVSDDVLALSVHGATIACAPGPPLVNLPAARPLEELGVEVAGFPDDDERWIHVKSSARKANPLAGVVLLNRDARPSGIERVPPNPLALLALSIHLDRTASGAAARFTLMGDVADRVPIYRLSGGRSDSPTQLADRVASTVFA